MSLEKPSRPENHEKLMHIEDPIPQWPYIAAEGGNDFIGGKWWLCWYEQSMMTPVSEIDEIGKVDEIDGFAVKRWDVEMTSMAGLLLTWTKPDVCADEVWWLDSEWVWLPNNYLTHLLLMT